MRWDEGVQSNNPGWTRLYIYEGNIWYCAVCNEIMQQTELGMRHFSSVTASYGDLKCKYWRSCSLSSSRVKGGDARDGKTKMADNYSTWQPYPADVVIRKKLRMPSSETLISRTIIVTYWSPSPAISVCFIISCFCKWKQAANPVGSYSCLSQQYFLARPCWYPSSWAVA